MKWWVIKAAFSPAKISSLWELASARSVSFKWSLANVPNHNEMLVARYVVMPWWISLSCEYLFLFQEMYSVSSLVVPKMEEGISGTGAVKNSK